MEILFQPDQLETIERELVERPPERLVHVLGRRLSTGAFLVQHLVVDGDADAHHAFVKASSDAEREINRLERAHGVHLLGVVHSHPRSVPEPSGQDGHALRDLLQLNSHLDQVFVGVVVDHQPLVGLAHVLPVGRGQLSVHAVSSPDRELTPARPGLAHKDLTFYADAMTRQTPEAAAAVIGRHVVVVGAGSLGSTVAEQLVRNGVPRVTVVDHDVVEAVNLTRSTYEMADLGRKKVDALSDRLRRINPAVAYNGLPWKIDDSTELDLLEVISGCDLVVAATDDPRAQGLIDALLHLLERPGVFGAVYRRGHGGEVVIDIPTVTACYRCTVAPRLEDPRMMPDLDYGTGRLAGAVALGIDVQIIALLLARSAMAVLGQLYGQDNWLLPALREQRSTIQVGLVPAFFDDLGAFDRTPAQHAWQSVWMRALGEPDCPDCPPAARRPADDHAELAVADDPPQPSQGLPVVHPLDSSAASAWRRLTASLRLLLTRGRGKRPTPDKQDSGITQAASTM